MKIGYDVLGNIAILKFDRGAKQGEKIKFAENYLKNNKSVCTILEKVDKFSGRLRTLKTKHLAGEKNKEALYRESGCEFRLNVDTCYFSPRLSSERLEVSRMVKKGEKVLVMFGGVAPFAIVIAKHSKAKEIVSVELGRECSKYAEINVKRNKLSERVRIVQGDVRRLQLLGKVLGVKRNNKFEKVTELSQNGFDRIVMARPNLKDSFLDVAFPIVKKSGIIHYYGFYNENEVEDLRKLIEDEAKKAGKKIKILRIIKAGDIGPYKFRYRADVKVLS